MLFSTTEERIIQFKKYLCSHTVQNVESLTERIELLFLSFVTLQKWKQGAAALMPCQEGLELYDSYMGYLQYIWAWYKNWDAAL